MKLFLPFCLLLTSCSTYKYVTFEHNADPDTDTSVKVHFRFTNYDEMEITVSNQSPKAVWVDWERSGLVHEKQHTSYYHNAGTISATTTSSTPGRRNATTAETKGELVSDKPKEFLPVQTELKKTIKLGLPAYKEIFHYQLERERTGKNNQQLSYKRKQFSEANSPFRFYSTMTLFNDKEENKTIAVTDSFYISELGKAPQGPEQVEKVKGINRYRSSNKELTQGGSALLIIGLLGVGVMVGGMN